MTTAFVLGGGGLLGAHQVGMLRALSEAGIRSDLVVGTSIGAINGVLVAADPAGAAGRLGRMWQGGELRLAFSEKIWSRPARISGRFRSRVMEAGRSGQRILPMTAGHITWW